MLRLLMARHGESVWQVEGNEAGPDSPLTKLGERQADGLGRWLAQEKVAIDHIYASPLQRAKKTAHLVAAHLDLPVRFNDYLQEAWFFIAPDLPAFAHGSAMLDNGQSAGRSVSNDYARFREQIAQALRDILAQHETGTILIVAHGGSLETAIRLLLGSDAFTVNMGNTTLHSLVWREDRWHIEYIDRWEHLRSISSDV